MKKIIGASILLGVCIGNVIGMEVMDRLWKKQYNRSEVLNKGILDILVNATNSVVDEKNARIEKLEKRLEERA